MGTQVTASACGDYDQDGAADVDCRGDDCDDSDPGLGWPGILVMAWVVWGRDGRTRMLMFPVMSPTGELNQTR